MLISTLTKQGAFDADSMNALNANFRALNAGIFPTQGNQYFVDPVNGRDGYTGTSPVLTNGQTAQNQSIGPFQTLLAAYNACTSGQNDIVYVLGNGLASGTARVDSSFTWSKNATHLFGVAAPVMESQRARIAPNTTATAFTPYFTVSGSGCIFQNIQWFMGFATGTTSQIGMVVTGSRNYFRRCHIAGIADNESAQSAGSRSLKISGGGENVFEDCSIGVDTITRTQANASLEFASATTRNYFRNCTFPFMGSAAGVLGILGTGAACMDRFQMFDNCVFLNAIKSSSTTMTVLASVTNASPGGLLMFKQCVLLGITDYGDTIGLANSYIDGFTGAAATSGIAVNPS